MGIITYNYSTHKLNTHVYIILIILFSPNVTIILEYLVTYDTCIVDG